MNRIFRTKLKETDDEEELSNRWKEQDWWILLQFVLGKAEDRL